MATIDQVVRILTNRRDAVSDIANSTLAAYRTANPNNPIMNPISNDWLNVGSGVTDTEALAHEGAGAAGVVRKGTEAAGTFVSTLQQLSTNGGFGLLDQTIDSGGNHSYAPAASLSESVLYVASAVDNTGQPVIVNPGNLFGGDLAILAQTSTDAARQWTYDGGDNDVWVEQSSHGTAAFTVVREGAAATGVVREGVGITGVVREGDVDNGTNVVRASNFMLPAGTSNSIIVAGDGTGPGQNGAPVGSFLVRNPASIQLSDTHIFANSTARNAGVTPGGTALIEWHVGDVSFITDENGDGTPSPANATYLYTNRDTDKVGPTIGTDWSRINAPGSGVTSVVDLAGAITDADISAALGSQSQQFNDGIGISFGDSNADDMIVAPILTVSGDIATGGSITSTTGLTINSTLALNLNGGIVPNSPHIRTAADVTADTNAVIFDGIELDTGSVARFGPTGTDLSIQATNGTTAELLTTGLTTLNIGDATLTTLNLRATELTLNGAALQVTDTRTHYEFLVPTPTAGQSVIEVPITSFTAGFENLGAATLTAVPQYGTHDLYLGGMKINAGALASGPTRRDYRILGTSIQLTFFDAKAATDASDRGLRLSLVVYS